MATSKVPGVGLPVLVVAVFPSSLSGDLLEGLSNCCAALPARTGVCGVMVIAAAVLFAVGGASEDVSEDDVSICGKTGLDYCIVARWFCLLVAN